MEKSIVKYAIADNISFAMKEEHHSVVIKLSQMASYVLLQFYKYLPTLCSRGCSKRLAKMIGKKFYKPDDREKLNNGQHFLLDQQSQCMLTNRK